jgi:hypothetical protein
LCYLCSIYAIFIALRRLGVKSFFELFIERGFPSRRAFDAAVKTQPLPETRFSLPDPWQRRLFLALCWRYGLEPYRQKGLRYTTVVVRAALLCGSDALAGIPGLIGSALLLSERGHGRDYSGGSL